MERQDTITLADFTKILESGAILRYQNDWHLYGSSFLPLENSKESVISVFCPDFFDVSTSKCLKTERHFVLSDQNFFEILNEFISRSIPQIEQIAGLDYLKKIRWEEPTLKDFSECFSRIQQMISQNQIDKAVPVNFSHAKANIGLNHKVLMLRQLMEAPKNLYVYGIWNSENGVIGASPEILFESEAKRITSVALAGTLPKGGVNTEADLIKDKKQRHEHQLVVDDIKKQLSRYGDVRSRGPEICSLPTLWHLLTKIEVEANDKPSPMELITILHPTPALGVYPRSFGIRWMLDLPGQKDRGQFGAPFLFRLSEEKWLCLVAIRNMIWSRDNLKIGSGCGIVRDSEIENEWTELFYKRESVKHILGFLT